MDSYCTTALAAVLVVVVVVLVAAAALEQSAILQQEFPNTLDKPKPELGPEVVVVLHNLVCQKDPGKDTMLE